MPTHAPRLNLYRTCAAVLLLLCPLAFTVLPRQEARQPVPVLQVGHEHQAVALRPDGRLAVTGGVDGLLKWWDRRTGMLIRTVPAHFGSVSLVSFNAAGTRLMSAGVDGFIKVWDAPGGRLSVSFRAAPGAVEHATFNARGDLIASSASDHKSAPAIRLWDARTGSPLNLLLGHSKQVAYLDFSPVSNALASGDSDGTVIIWSASGQVEQTIKVEGFDSFLDFSPDGSTLAVATYFSDPTRQELSFHDTQTGRKRHSFKDSEYWGPKVMSANWQYFVTSYEEKLKVWDVAGGQPVRVERNRVSSGGVSIDSEGETVAVSGSSSPIFWPSASLVNSGTGAPLFDSTTGLAVSREHGLVAWGGGNKVYVWDSAAAALLHVLEGHTSPVNEVAFSPDGRTLASCSNEEVKLWSARDGARLGNLTSPREQGVLEQGWNGSQSVSFSPDGKLLATGMLKVTMVKKNEYKETVGVRVWEAGSRRLLNTFELTQPQKVQLPPDPDGEKDAPFWVRSVAFGPDGKTIAWDDGSTRVMLLDRHTGNTRVLKGHAREIKSIAFSADGRRLVSASFDRTVKLWDVASGDTLHTMKGHQRRVTTARFSPDGRVVISGGVDRTVRLWDTGSGSPLATLEGHDKAVTSAGVSPDGKTIYTTGLDGRVSLWSLPGRALVATLVAGQDRTWVCFAPEGYYKGQDAEKYLGWRVGDDIYPASAYRAQLFRPEFVLAKLNGSPPPVVAARPPPVTAGRPPTARPPLPVSRGVSVRMRNARGQSEVFKLYEGSYALLIGNSQYADWDDLPGVRADMAEVGDALKKQGFNVVSFDEDGSPVLDRPAMNLTQAEFRRQMTLFIDTYGQDWGNRLLIYYAGHGYTAMLPDKRKMGYLVMRDAPRMPPAEEAIERGLSDRELRPFARAAINMDQMNTFAKDILARHALFVFDSCFAGTVLFRRGEPRVPPYVSAEVAEPVREFLTAGNELQEVNDESAFRKAFVRGIQGAADAAFGDRPKDGYVLATELYLYVRQEVSTYTEKTQTPIFGKIVQQELARGDFVFVYAEEQSDRRGGRVP